MLAGEHQPGAADAGLRLIHDQHHPAFAALRLQRAKVTRRKDQDAAAGQDGFGDEGGQIARALPVQQGKAVVQFLLPGDAGEPRMVWVWRWDRERPGRHRTIAPPSGRVGGCSGAAGHAVPGLGKPSHLPLAGHQFGDPDRRLVRLAPGRQQHCARQAGRQAGEPPCQIDHWLAEHGGEQVHQPSSALPNGRGNLRMRVTQDGAHLAGGEIQHATPGLIVDERALRPVGKERHELPTIAQQVTSGVGRHGVGHVRPHSGGATLGGFGGRL